MFLRKRFYDCHQLYNDKNITLNDVNEKQVREIVMNFTIFSLIDQIACFHIDDVVWRIIQ